MAQTAKQVERDILNIVMEFPYCYPVQKINDVWNWISNCDDYDFAMEIEDMMDKYMRLKRKEEKQK